MCSEKSPPKRRYTMRYVKIQTLHLVRVDSPSSPSGVSSIAVLGMFGKKVGEWVRIV